MWTPMSERRPCASDWDAHGKILIWDSNNGCMVGKVESRRDILREPVTHWQAIPGKWIPKVRKMPTIFDADRQGCVLVLDMHTGAKMMGWNNPAFLDHEIVGWQKAPAAPESEA